MTPEGIDSLSRQELVALVLGLSEQVAVLQARVAELEAGLDVLPKTPDNSSLPPSRGQKANIAKTAKKRRRKGRPGTTRRLAENPDKVRNIFAETCSACGHVVAHTDQLDAHAYDHIDLPPITPVVTRVRLHRGRCPCCGKRVLCHERCRSKRRRATVREMKEGPSGSAVRGRSQGTASCCRKERR